MNRPQPLRRILATRYVKALREGGSLPAIVEADDDGMYVVKFRGAGQGHKALVAELVAGEIGRALGLAIPEIVLVDIDPALARTEPDDEIRDLLKRSAGLNLALDYLPGSLAYDPVAPQGVDAALASRVVWFDAYVNNVDRTPRNTNLLQWHRKLWLIDHGASLIVHHDWTDREARAKSPFKGVRDHVLLPKASELRAADTAARAALDEDLLRAILDAIPDEWLVGDATFAEPAEQRAAYFEYLTTRLGAAAIFVEEAERARALLV